MCSLCFSSIKSLVLLPKDKNMFGFGIYNEKLVCYVLDSKLAVFGMLQCIITKFSHKVDNHSVLHFSYKKENWSMCPNVWFSKIGSHFVLDYEVKRCQITEVVFQKGW